MITDYFKTETASPGSKRGSYARSVTVAGFIVCLIFLYNNGRVYEFIAKKEEHLLRRKRVDVEMRKRELAANMYSRALWSFSGSGHTILSRPKQCTPRSNIAFLKTHCAGASVVTNLLNRYGEKHNLTFLLPKRGEFTFGWPNKLSKTYFAPLRNQVPNILCNHARYNREVLDLVMPKDTAFVTILRNPADQFISALHQHELTKVLGIGTSGTVEELLSNPWEFFETKLSHENLTAEKFKSLAFSTRNGMLLDLGMPLDKRNRRKFVQEYIQRLEKEFDLVMISEYFLESLILLKDLMCWDLDDMVYIVPSIRADHRKVPHRVKKEMRELNTDDNMLYRHFNESFWRKIKTYGKEFGRNVNSLRSKVQFWEQTCEKFPSDEKEQDERFMTQDNYRLARIYNKTLDFVSMCRDMKRNETSFLEYFRKTTRASRAR